MQKTSSLKIGIYARFSSDLQNPTSVRDQAQVCRSLIAEQFSIGQSRRAKLFHDNAISGATMKRPGLLNLLEAVESGDVDLIVAEGLDRLSRNLKDIATIHETLSYHGVEILTSHEGKITALHVGLKGTMNALFLSDMKAKVRRGQKARVEAGFSSSSVPYGYRKVYGATDAHGREQNGVREIASDEAETIQRIFNEYAEGKSLIEIVGDLNADGIPSPTGKEWKKNSLLGSSKKKDGILRNETYLGKLIYNKSYVVRDPMTNKKTAIYNPEDKWTKVDVPHMRIVADELWNRVRERDKPRTITQTTKKRRVLSSHNQHALTGWVKCGECDSAKSIGNASRYVCSGYRYARTCTNARGTKEQLLYERVTEYILDRIKNGPDFRDSFVLAFFDMRKRNEELQAEAEELRNKIKRLVLLVAEGISDDHTSAIIHNLQDELQITNDQIKELPDLNIPQEDEIRNTLFDKISQILLGHNIEKQRIIFTHILEEIVLTPIKSQRSGESICISLREQGFPELWQRVAQSGKQQNPE